MGSRYCGCTGECSCVLSTVEIVGAWMWALGTVCITRVLGIVGVWRMEVLPVTNDTSSVIDINCN